MKSRHIGRKFQTFLSTFVNASRLSVSTTAQTRKIHRFPITSLSSSFSLSARFSSRQEHYIAQAVEKSSRRFRLNSRNSQSQTSSLWSSSRLVRSTFADNESSWRFRQCEYDRGFPLLRMPPEAESHPRGVMTRRRNTGARTGVAGNVEMSKRRVSRARVNTFLSMCLFLSMGVVVDSRFSCF